MFSARIATRLPLRLIDSSSRLPRGFGEERPHQRLQVPAAALGALVLAALALAHAERHRHFLPALLAVELVVWHASLLLSGRYRPASGRVLRTVYSRASAQVHDDRFHLG